MELLLVKKLLQSWLTKLERSQREKIFHTCCRVFENICSIIMNNGSYCNCCSYRLVEKLALSHPHPYKLDWISQDSGAVFQHQVSMYIVVGNI